MEENIKHCNCQCHNHENHHHHINKKHFHFRKTLLSKTYLVLFLTCIVTLLIITIINIILKLNEFNFPTIFFPGLLIYIATFICAGGVLGSYGPINRIEPDLMQMRKCSSIVMFIICVVIFPIFFYQNINFYSSIKESKIYCLENNNKSKGEIYSQLIDEKEKLYVLRNNFEYKYKNGLTCLENRKCVKSISNSKLFICNFNYEEMFENNTKCNKVFETDHLVNTFDNANMAYFVSSCMDLKKDKIRPDLELFRCISNKNLCKEDSITDKDKLELQKYYDKNTANYDKQIANVSAILETYYDELYSYEETCYSNRVYIFCYFLIFLHILIKLFICIIWAVLGISNILKITGYMEDTELIYYKEKLKTMNNLYQQVHLSKDNNYEIDENTPINLK